MLRPEDGNSRNRIRFALRGTLMTRDNNLALYMPSFQPVLEGYDFVAYPNRNSVPFKEFYNIPEAETVIRGSLRYEGNPVSNFGALTSLEMLTPKFTIGLCQGAYRPGLAGYGAERLVEARIDLGRGHAQRH